MCSTRFVRPRASAAGEGSATLPPAGGQVVVGWRNRQHGAAVGHGCRPRSQQQGIGQPLELAGQVFEQLAQRNQHRLMAGVGLEDVEIEFAGQQVVAHFQDQQQHAGQLQPARRARRLQQHVARRLQVVGQGRLFAQQPADQRRLAGRLGRRSELAGLRSNQGDQRQQRVRQHQRAITRIQHGVGERRPDQVQAGAQREIQAAVHLAAGRALRAPPSRRSSRT